MRQQFKLGHLLLCKWIVLAKAKPDKEVLRWGQCLLHRRHEQLPMPLAIVLQKGIAKAVICLAQRFVQLTKCQ
jgi:hypothetical protein